MTIELVTGVPGAGKTLYTVAEKLRPIQKLNDEARDAGKPPPRRIVCCGLPDLLIEHELAEYGRFDAESSPDPHGDREREPGTPPVDGVPMEVTAWWLWCRPGDLIVVDECQQLFRPQAAGRRIPRFISRLERHRHYGVDFIVITQHPQLVHTSVRNLVGMHEHVRRVWGGSQTIVYTWDHCTNPDRVKNATKRPWKHKRAAFGLYKSAALHTKRKQPIPLVAFMFLFALVGIGPAAYYAYTRVIARGQPQAPPAASATPGATGGASATHGGPGGSMPSSVPGLPRVWPELNVEPRPSGEPYHDRALHAQGCLIAGELRRCAYSVSIAGRVVAQVTEAELVRAGYVVRHLGPCAIELLWDGARRSVTCDAPAVEPAAAQHLQQPRRGDGGEAPMRSAPSV